MGNYLVTGGAGFIGSAVAAHLIGNGHNVTIIDNLSKGFRENIPNGAEFIKGNCQDKEIYVNLNHRKFEAIYHIAGQSSGEISFDDPVYDLQTNTQSTLLLLQFAQDIECKRLLYASSMSVYGDRDDAASELTPCFPKSFYAVGKLASEHYLRIYSQYGVKSTVFRISNVYGPGQNLSNLRQGMLSIYLAQAIKNKHIIVKGSGDRFRDFVYIDDVVRAFIKCERNIEAFDKIYNVATGKKITVSGLINKLITFLPYKISIEYIEGTPGDQFGIFADIGLVEKEIGWRPKINLDQGLNQMVQWALAGKLKG